MATRNLERDSGDGTREPLPREAKLSFPPHVKGPRQQCSVCKNIVTDSPVIEIGNCHHPVENYHVLEVDNAGIKPAMTLACQEDNCDGRGFSSIKS